MRTLSHWIAAAVDSQPFYSEEIRMIRLTLAFWRFRMPGVSSFSG